MCQWLESPIVDDQQVGLLVAAFQGIHELGKPQGPEQGFNLMALVPSCGIDSWFFQVWGLFLRVVVQIGHPLRRRHPGPARNANFLLRGCCLPKNSVTQGESWYHGLARGAPSRSDRPMDHKWTPSQWLLKRGQHRGYIFPEHNI